MREPYGQGLATQPGPESCAHPREGRSEALAGVRAGRVLSCEIKASAQRADHNGVPTQSKLTEGHTRFVDIRETRRDPAQSETPSMHGNILRGNREILRSSAGEGSADRVGKSKDERR